MERQGLFLRRPEPAAGRCGVLVANLGTPEAPTPRALRPYLRQFLRDPRVIELPRWKWLPILHLFVLPTRPRRSARLYANIWTPAGSPLLVHTREIARGLAERLRPDVDGEALPLEIGMTYGEPSIAGALRRLGDAGCSTIVVLPLFPQYFAGTTGSILDAVGEELKRWRHVPTLRTVGGWTDHPAYIAALAASLREEWARDGNGPGERVLFSFHGIPRRYADHGDPYPRHCERTARLLAAELGLTEERWLLTYQSLFGREPWLAPYTDRTLDELARQGVRTADVICPGFATDCLETLDEVGREARETFEAAGGLRLRYIPCLNARPDHLNLLTTLVHAALPSVETQASGPA